MEQFYAGFLEENGFRTSVSNYVSGMHFGHVGGDLGQGIRMEVRWFNSGKVDLRDSYGNLIGVEDYTFIDLRVRKGNLWFDILYQPLLGSDLGISMGFRYYLWRFVFLVDNLGVNMPVRAGLSYRDAERGIFASLSWELPYGWIYDITFRKRLMGIETFVSKSNRFDYMAGGSSITSGIAMGILIRRGRFGLGYMFRNLGGLGFQSTVELTYE